MMSTSSKVRNGLLSEVTFTQVPNGLIAQARFNADAYDPILFDKHRIARPAQIAQASPKRQVDFLAGRLLAHAALETFERPAKDIPIGPDCAPVWPLGVNGSISHGKGACMALVARNDHLCGIDCEGIARGNALDAVMTLCLSASERGWVARQTHQTKDVVASLVFSAKESIYKALAPRVQRFFGFECAEVQGWSGQGGLLFKLTHDLHPDFPAGFELRVNCWIDCDLVRTWVLFRCVGVP